MMGEEVGGGDPMSQVQKLMVGDFRSKFIRAIQAYALATTAYEISKRWIQTYKYHTSFTVRVSGDDAIWPEIHQWLLEQQDSRKMRSWLARSTRASNHHNQVPESPGQRDEEPAMRLYSDDHQPVTTFIEGHKVEVNIGQNQHDTQILGADNPFARKEMVFTVRTLEARQVVVGMLREMADARFSRKREPRSFIATTYGHWRMRTSFNLRPLSSVYLREGQKERVVADLARFLDAAPRYQRYGIPYHRGYLFHGPAGTGKTSIVKALADHFKLDLYYMPISDLDKDTSLLELVASVEPHSILLLEDVDVLHSSHDRKERDDDDDEKTVTLSGLLNALDGMITPEGLITIMTTNRIEVLDDAVIRPGRVDLIEKIDVCNDYQAQALMRAIAGTGVDLPTIRTQDKITAAELVEVYKRHMDQDRKEIANAFVQYASDRRSGRA